MPILSDNPMWEMFGMRALSYVGYGGSDLGECFSTVQRVGNGTRDDWYGEWTRTAERVFSFGKSSQANGHFISAREAYFRASTTITFRIFRFSVLR